MQSAEFEFGGTRLSRFCRHLHTCVPVSYPGIRAAMQRLFGAIGSLGLLATLIAAPACVDDATAPRSADETGTADMVDTLDELTALDDSDVTTNQSCGGLLGLTCPEGKVCVDDPSDNCELGNGADCPGVCKNENFGGANGKKGCNKGPGVNYVADADTCPLIKFACAEGEQPFFDACGCGCEPADEPAGEPCGDTVCGDGLVCCNASCGICTPPDGACIQIACAPGTKVEDNLDQLSAVDDAQTTAKKDPIFCGGFAGIQCPEGLTCVDDPSDDCDAKNGGADCGGICKKGKGGNGGGKPNKCERGSDYTYVAYSPEECAAIRFVCESGEAFFNDCGCGCVG